MKAQRAERSRSKRITRLSAIVVAVFLLELAPASAGPTGRAEIPPKDWSGTIRASHATSTAATLFKENGCSWAGAEALNGLDSIIWDVKDHAGLEAQTTWAVSQPGSAPPRLSGYFIDSSCRAINGVLWRHDRDTADKPQTIVIPNGAVWAVVDATFIGVSPDIEVKMHSDGYKPPKKKKKKKRR